MLLNFNNESDDVISESILSVAKDVRFIQQCQSLLQQAFKAFLVREEFLVLSGGGSEGQHQELLKIRKQSTWLISFILYLCLVVMPMGRSLGMDACGLTFSNDVVSNTQTQQAKTTILTTRPNRSIFAGLSLVIAALSGLVREYYFAASTSSEITKTGENNNEHGIGSNNQQQQQEQLRGRERNLMYEKLRRQMLERAKSASENFTSDDGIANDDLIIPLNSYQQEQNNHQNGIIQIDNVTARKVNETSSSSKYFWSILRRLSKFISEVTDNSSDGPHDIVLSNDGDNIDSNNHNNNNNNNSISCSVALWYIRLHLARYLLTGNYPTVMHQFLGLNPIREKITDTTTGSMTNKSTILSRPNTNRAIAFLIFLQASTSLIQTSTNWFARKVANYLEYHALKNTGNQINIRSFRLLIQKRLDSIFNSSVECKEKVTEQKCEEKQQHHNYYYSDGAKLNMSSDNRKNVCTICRRDRIHPAAPSSCGHVCCWNCLIQWVSTVRAECPLCRSPCKAQDILALYNYDPVT
mmetsp:Transcript_19070/g.21889  ORF Transcript_19070/g.21889 Transcript_19070/m.21889 type:complete len:524 (-) Transcript_19070:95-1666(-)